MTNEIDAKIIAFLAENPLWREEAGALVTELRFAGFGKAIDFMAALKPEIIKLRHHPEWTNIYNRISFRLITHDCNSITELDLKLAALISRAYAANASDSAQNRGN